MAASKLQTPLNFSHGKWGGARKGAGRKRKNNSGIAHTQRPELNGRNPLHVTLKFREGFDSPRLTLFRAGFPKMLERARKKGLRVNHFSIQNDHIHLICEVPSKRSMERGFRSLNTSVAAAIKKLGPKRRTRPHQRGRVLRTRYHLHVLKSPREVRNALVYVLLNTAKHSRSPGFIDKRYSSAALFREWEALLGKDGGASNAWRTIKPQLLEPAAFTCFAADELCAPSTWLLKEGWKKATDLGPARARIRF